MKGILLFVQSIMLCGEVECIGGGGGGEGGKNGRTGARKTVGDSLRRAEDEMRLTDLLR